MTNIVLIRCTLILLKPFDESTQSQNWKCHQTKNVILQSQLLKYRSEGTLGVLKIPPERGVGEEDLQGGNRFHVAH